MNLAYFSAEVEKISEVGEEQVKELHAKIRELAVTNDFLVQPIDPHIFDKTAAQLWDMLL